MRITCRDETLHVSGIDALSAANSQAFHSQLSTALASPVKQIELDLSQAAHMDCGGVGALVALRNWVRKDNRAVSIRVLNPTGPARQLLQLTRMDGVFPIEHR